ncbi:hypothetical protein COOONC_15732 [Cooperia oncophora]
MLSRVRSFASDPQHRFASSAIVIVLTHGERDQLLGVSGDDDVLSVYPFLEALNARNAPLLAGKPKLVFIQACRGGECVAKFETFFHIFADECSRTYRQYLAIRISFVGYTIFSGSSEF